MDNFIAPTWTLSRGWWRPRWSRGSSCTLRRLASLSSTISSWPHTWQTGNNTLSWGIIWTLSFYVIIGPESDYWQCLSVTDVLRTGSMGHLSKSPTTISKISSNFGKIGLKKMLGGVVLPPRTLFSPGVSFSQWTSQWLPRSWNWQKRLLSHCWPIHCHP